MSKKFIVKKTKGSKQVFKGGMVRGLDESKPNYLLLWQPMLKRWAEHMTKGAKHYGKHNWMKASGRDELERFQESALRHMFQWLNGEIDEDHASAVFFNITGAEYIKNKLNENI